MVVRMLWLLPQTEGSGNLSTKMLDHGEANQKMDAWGWGFGKRFLAFPLVVLTLA